ncbi:MAG: 50S ribosomal protein L11 methyltransferase [Woeseiaceae bacterium]|nr:50S ribosomal protein L11 methyltransferase [Woeseiaceae bacterium]
MNWRQFVMDLENLNPDTVEEVFARHGAASITYTDAGDRPVLEPAPGDAPLWADTRISALFSTDIDTDAVQDDLKRALAVSSLPRIEIDELEDRDWEREWLKDFAPMRFGRRLWVCPGDMEAADTDAITVRLDPGLAFGTGTHATTALCLEWLDGIGLDGATVLDYGCGSGILAIAALKLGAKSAVAIDIDPQAVEAAQSNALQNGTADSLTTTINASEVNEEFDAVVANILAGPLVELAESIAVRVNSGCSLALSGILSGQVDEVLAAYSPWIEFEAPVFREQGGQVWALLTGRRIEG